MSKPVETSLLYAEAKLDLKEGNWEEAVSKEQTLIDRFRHIGNRWVVARNLINLGDALLGRDAPGDRERAKAIPGDVHRDGCARLYPGAGGAAGENAEIGSILTRMVMVLIL
jgi:hypothetical protein